MSPSSQQTRSFTASTYYDVSSTRPTLDPATGVLTWTNATSKLPTDFSVYQYVKTSENNYVQLRSSGTSSGTSVRFTVVPYTRMSLATQEATYAFTVGNGTDTTPSNAHTVDWSGNANYAGDVYVQGDGTNSFSGRKKLATEEYVDTKAPPIKVLSRTIFTNIIETTPCEYGFYIDSGIGENDVIKVAIDYNNSEMTDDAAVYREAVRNAMITTNSITLQEDGTYRIGLNFDGDPPTNISKIFLTIFNYGPGGAW